MRKGVDEGTAMGRQFVGAGLGIGALLWMGHEHAMAAKAARERDANDAAMAGNLTQLHAVAKNALRDLGEAHAEIARLKRALAQRQDFIDRQRRAAA
jgi:hypothetical protein